MKKITIEIDKKLCEGELLLYKDGRFVSVEIHELLPELKIIKDDISELKKLKDRIVELEGKVKELRGED